MIISGYAGIGKSWLAHNFPNVMDLESTPFDKDWDRYAKCAKYYHKQGYVVLTSCHKEIRERLCNFPDRVLFEDRITVVPDISDKELYLRRYTQRGNSEKFIMTQMDNWENWLNEKKNRILTESWIVMNPGETLYDTILRLSKESPRMFCSYDNCPVPTCKELPCINPLAKIVENWSINK